MSLSKGNSVVRSLTIGLYTGLSNRLTTFISQYIPGFTTERALTSLALILIVKKTLEAVAAHRRRVELLERARRKRRERDNQIAHEFTPTNEIPEELTTLVLNSTVSELIRHLNDDRVTSEQILRIYHNRAITIGAKLDLIAESNFPEALELAKQCDQVRRDTPKEERHKLGLIFGVPISVKDRFKQKGFDSTCGMAKYCFNPSAEDGIVIKAIKAQGGLPFMRTNVSQTLAAYDSSNNIWGSCLNPWCIDRTPGGSSGGDSGLVAAKCSPISYGTDIYGSIRIPAAFTGTYGFKATSGRLPQAGEPGVAIHDMVKSLYLRASTGPIGRSVDDLVLVCKTMIVPELRDYYPSYPYLPWNEEKYSPQKKMKIGYIESADIFGSSKPCKRAVKEAIAALEKAGHEVVEVRIPNFEAMVLLIIRVLFVEGGAQRFYNALDGEKPEPNIRDLMAPGRVSNLTKKILRAFLGKRLQNAIDQTMELSTNESTLALSQLCVFRDQFLKYFVDWKLDAIITPACALPAFPLEYGIKLLLAGCYLWLGNLGNTPAGVVPITKVQPGEDVYTSEDTIYNDDLLFKYSEKCMNGSVGLPVGVQVMALPFEDEKCLAVMKALEDQVKFHELPDIN